MGRAANWILHDDRLLRNIVARDDLSALEVFRRYNRDAHVKRGSVALSSRISTQRFIIAEHHDIEVGGLPGVLREMNLPAPVDSRELHVSH